MRDEAGGGERFGTRSHEVSLKFSRTSYKGNSKQRVHSSRIRRVDWYIGIKSSEELAASFLRVIHVLSLHGRISQETGIFVISSVTTSDAPTENV